MAEQVGLSRAGDKGLLINIWASWCGPCRREMPDLQRLAGNLDQTGFSIVGISVDEDRFLAEELLRKYSITFPNYHDPGQRAINSILEVRVLPQTLVVSPDGDLVARIRGLRDWNDQSTIDELNEMIMDKASRHGG